MKSSPYSHKRKYTDNVESVKISKLSINRSTSIYRGHFCRNCFFFLNLFSFIDAQGIRNPDLSRVESNKITSNLIDFFLNLDLTQTTNQNKIRIRTEFQKSKL